MSSNSDECNCDSLNEYNVEFASYGSGNCEYQEQSNPYSLNNRSPYYTQPYVYYAQVPQTCCQPTGNTQRKDNKNCFSKAFHWYTKDHVPKNANADKKSDMKAFAKWLDSKYDQFLQENIDNADNDIKRREVTETHKLPNERLRRRFRVKSPWRKKRSFKASGDVTPKGSFQYIMKPRDVSLPTSECYKMSSSVLSSEVYLKHCSQSCTSLKTKGEPCLTIRSQEEIKTSSCKPIRREDIKLHSKQRFEKQASCKSRKPKINVQPNYDPSIKLRPDTPLAKELPCSVCRAEPVKITRPMEAPAQLLQTNPDQIECHCRKERMSQNKPHVLRQNKTNKIFTPKEVQATASQSDKENTCCIDAHSPVGTNVTKPATLKKDLHPKEVQVKPICKKCCPKEVQVKESQLIMRKKKLNAKEIHIQTSQFNLKKTCPCPKELVPTADAQNQYEATETIKQKREKISKEIPKTKQLSCENMCACPAEVVHTSPCDCTNELVSVSRLQSRCKADAVIPNKPDIETSMYVSTCQCIVEHTHTADLLGQYETYKVPSPEKQCFNIMKPKNNQIMNPMKLEEEKYLKENFNEQFSLKNTCDCVGEFNFATDCTCGGPEKVIPVSCACPNGPVSEVQSCNRACTGIPNIPEEKSSALEHTYQGKKEHLRTSDLQDKRETHEVFQTIDIKNFQYPKEIQTTIPENGQEFICRCAKEAIQKVDVNCQCITQTTTCASGPNCCVVLKPKKVALCPSIDNKMVEGSRTFPSPCSQIFTSSNPSTFANEGIQTSDHALQIERISALAPPMFMRVVFTDKLYKSK